VAKVLNLSIPTIHALIRRGDLTIAPHIKRNQRITVASVEKFVERANQYVHPSARENVKKGETYAAPEQE
jgi:hypothetical protein